MRLMDDYVNMVIACNMQNIKFTTCLWHVGAQWTSFVQSVKKKLCIEANTKKKTKWHVEVSYQTDMAYTVQIGICLKWKKQAI